MSNNIKVLSSKEANAKWKVNDLHNDNISDGNLLDYQFNDMTFDNLSNPNPEMLYIVLFSISEVLYASIQIFKAVLVIKKSKE